jgi:predicted metal-dependent peptidase
MAERAGSLPGGTGRAIKETREAVLDWRAELQAFVTNCIESDQSWARPNRRFVSRGVYLPGMVKENVGTIAVGVDVSGSVDQAMLDAFAAELNGIMRDARPERMVVLYVDHVLQATAEFTPDDEVVLKMTGGGGTCFQPAFDWIEENDVDPLAFVYLTDLYGPAPVEPAYPVLWVTPIFSHAQEPFGTRVVIP